MDAGRITADEAFKMAEARISELEAALRAIIDRRGNLGNAGLMCEIAEKALSK